MGPKPRLLTWAPSGCNFPSSLTPVRLPGQQYETGLEHEHCRCHGLVTGTDRNVIYV